MDDTFQLFNALQEQIKILASQVTGLTAAHQITLEILMSQSTAQKQAMAQILSQILARSESIPNQYCREVLETILEVSRLPSRTSPDGRRGWMHLVSPPDSE